MHQERNLVPGFSVGENIVLQQLPHRARPGRPRRDPDGGVALPGRAGARHRPGSPVDASSRVAQAQLVEIAKALSVDSRVLLLDEPTASLTADEADRLFAVVRKLRDDGPRGGVRQPQARGGASRSATR